MGRVPIPGVGAHARDRMAERIGRDLTRVEWLDAVARILDSRAARLYVMPNGSEHYLHDVGGVLVRLVWMPEWALVVTVMEAERGPAEGVRRAQLGDVKQTLAVCEKWRRGKRLARRTCWVPPEVRG